jgi:hypothetical protein
VRFDALTSAVECNNWLKGPLGCWWRYGIGQKVKTDATAPNGQAVIEMVFPAGLQPGWGQDMFGGWAVGGPIEYREMYESGWVKIPTPDFETQLACVKLFGYWGAGERRSGMPPTQLAMEIEGNGQATSVMSSWNMMVVQQDVVSRRLDQNLNVSKKFTAGSWHQYEIRMTTNDIGRNNGSLRVWLDGVPILAYTDVVYRDSNNTAGFFGRKWDPIWGCGGGAAKSRNDYLWVNSVYISGIPM